LRRKPTLIGGALTWRELLTKDERMSGSQPATEPANGPVENLDPTPFQETIQAAADGKADSSTAPETGETRETLLEATRRALQESDSPPDSTDKGAEAKDGEAAKADAPVDGEAKPDETAEGDADADKDEPPPFHKHPRWQQVTRERAELRQRVDELQPRAERMQQIEAYMATNELSPEDVRQGFAIMAALRQDPAEAWKLMEPIVRSVRTFLGDELPDDLREKVDTGLVDEDTAREAARLRHQQTFQAERQRRQADRQAQQRVTAQTVQAEQARVSAVDTWFQAKQADPDFASIAPFVEGETLRMQARWRAEGKSFDAPEQAVVLMNQVWTDLRLRLKPQRQAIRSTPAASPSPTAATGARPATLMDALRAAV
jgi:hypothetical protein